VSDLDLRVSDAERQVVVERLAAHYGAGRLDAEELEERTARANAAKTRGELVVLEADLPDAEPAVAPAPRVKRELSRQQREKIAGSLTIVVILWVVWLASGASGFVWPAIPTAVIGLGLWKNVWLGDGTGYGGAASLPDAPQPPQPPDPPQMY
jgi:hypothetical protein